jgi:hypothetical protein
VFNGVRVRLTLLYLAAALTLILVMGGGRTDLARLFQSSRPGTAAQMAHEFTLLGAARRAADADHWSIRQPTMSGDCGPAWAAMQRPTMLRAWWRITTAREGACLAYDASWRPFSCCR